MVLFSACPPHTHVLRYFRHHFQEIANVKNKEPMMGSCKNLRRYGLLVLKITRDVSFYITPV